MAHICQCYYKTSSGLLFYGTRCRNTEIGVVCAECVEVEDEGTSGFRVDEAIGVISADEDESLPGR